MPEAFAGEPSRDSYDAVVIGAGIGGLSAAAFLAHAGLRVLVAERAEAPGGYAKGFEHDGYRFDPAVHIFPDGGPDGLPVALLELLGVADLVDFRLVDSFYTAVLDDARLRAPFGIDELIEVHARQFPAEREAIANFFRLCHQVHHEAHVLPPALGLGRLDEIAERFPVLVRYLRATTDEALEGIADPRLRGLATVSWPYMGSPPARNSFVTFATTVSTFSDGSYYPTGGFQALVDALVAAIVRNGGEIVVGTPARRIETNSGRVAGVALAEGSVRTSTVVSNAAATSTFEELVGAENLPSAFVQRQRRLRPSTSAVVVFVGTSLDLPALGASHEVFRPLHFDHEQTWRDIDEGRPGGMWGTVSTIVDPTMAPAGHHTLTITSLARHDIGRPWASEAERYTDEVLAAWEVPFPGLRESITHLETATPETLERRTANTGGAIYGWDNIPTQSGGRRSPHAPPVEGLFLSGHWTQPGSGSIRCLVSGFHAAQLVLAAAGSDPIEFAHPSLPPAA